MKVATGGRSEGHLRCFRTGWLVAAVLIVSGGCNADWVSTESRPAEQTTSTSSGVAGSSPWADIPAIVRRVEPSVVTILTGQGLGSGVVWSSDGVIVTVNHVVAGIPEVEVAFADGQRVPGTVEARDPITDIAIVRVGRSGLPAARFASRLPEVGELAVAIGSPLGFEETVTAGIISGTQRAIPGSAATTQSLVDLLQTDAAISPGNSGGALVDARSTVVGLNEAYIPPAAGAVSIGFAIPAPTVADVVRQLLESGHAEHAFLGAQFGNVTQEMASALGIDRQSGALVIETTTSGPAAKAGLRPGDVVIAIDGREVNTVEDLLTVIRGHRPGEVVAVVVDRRGERNKFQVKLVARSAGQ